MWDRILGNTLLIDNYDSFTYNLYALIAETSGQAPIVVLNDEADWVTAVADDIDRIIISPGPGRPQRQGDLGLSAHAILSGHLPVLGVCLGHQAIGLLCGATVDLAPEPVHGRRSRIRHLGVDLFEGIPSPFQAVRYHSLAVTNLPEQLQGLAWAEDGTLMGLRHRSRPLWGVQFHPESILTEYGATTLRRFFELTAPQCRKNLVTHRRKATAVKPRSVSDMCWRVFAFRAHSQSDPGDLFDELYGTSEAAFWLDSARSEDEDGRFSYMGDAAGPHAETVRYRSSDHTLEILRAQGRISRQQDIFSYLEAETAARRASGAGHLPFGFTGGYVGYFGYELKGELRGRAPAPAETPDSCWIFADRLIVFDHQEHTLWLVCVDDQRGLCAENLAWVENTQRLLSATTAGRRRTATVGAAQPQEPCDLKWRHGALEYRGLIQSALRAIREGETYEVCLTNRLSGTCNLEPFEVYRALRTLNPASYGAFVRVHSLSILCSSPELFLKIASDGVVESRPIKGTARRAADPVEDERRACELAQSVKNMSENLMIVDLLRNDLNTVCEVGSVHVPKIFHVERHASVHQLVSTIRGRLRSDVTLIDCVRAAFPGGSMTGAPKVRTMALLDALERGPRGIYSGSLGYLSTDGSAKLNIVIRTIVMDGSRLEIGTGGAIVALSDPEEEVRELLMKIEPLLRALRCSSGAVRLDAAVPCH